MYIKITKKKNKTPATSRVRVGLKKLERAEQLI